MIIAFFTPELSHPSGKRIGGLGNVALEMINYLSQNEMVELYVFSPSSINANEIHKEEDTNITYHWFPDNLIGVDSNENFNKYIMSMNSMMIDYVEKEYLSMDNEFFQIIHCHDWMTAPIILKLHTLKYPKIRRIFHLHSSEIGRNGNKILYNDKDSMQRHLLEVQGSHSADLVITVSELFKEEISNNFNVSLDKIHFVNNGMNFDPWIGKEIDDKHEIRKSIGGGMIIGKNDPVFLFCGRIVWQKNPKLLLDAFLLLANKFPNAHLVYMGDGHMKYKLEQMAKKQNIINKQVHFLGSVYGQDKIKWYRSADCLVVPSFNEPFGLIFIESLICKTPVLYPLNVAANKFLTNGKHGLSFQTKSIELAKVMLRVINEPKEMRKIGECGYDHVLKNFNLKVMGKSLYAEYEEINKLQVNVKNNIFYMK